MGACWCCGTAGINHLPYVQVVAMNAEAAKAFMMPDAAKVVCVGQADPTRYQFGARRYYLFKTVQAYNYWLTTEKTL